MLSLVLATAPIIGGTAPTTADYPSVVAILVGTHICSGTLIAPDWVLTAAHCVLPSEVGQPDQAGVTSAIRVYGHTVSLPKHDGKTYTASETFANPAFSPAHYGTSDIGLVHLASPIADLAPSPVSTAVAPVGIVVTQVGFGATLANAGGTTGIEYALADRTSTACAPYAADGADDANVLCFDQTDGKGICDGDSGGPSLAVIGGVPTVVAFTSFGDGPCTRFSAHTRVSAETAFLCEHIPGLDACAVDATPPSSGGCCDGGGGAGGGAVVLALGIRTRRRRKIRAT